MTKRELKGKLMRITLVIVFLTFLLSVAVASERTFSTASLLENSDFESGVLYPWYSTSSSTSGEYYIAIGVDDLAPYEGIYGAYISIYSDQNEWGRIIQEPIEIIPGEKITLEAELMYWFSLDSGYAELYLVFLDSSMNSVGSVYKRYYESDFVEEDNWIHVSLTTTVPSGAKYARVMVGLDDVKVCDLNIDNVILQSDRGSLTVTVKNAEGKPMPSCGGTVEALLYDKYWTYLGRESKSYSGGESSVQIQFDDLAEDDYFIEVYQTPNTGLDLEEYWGGDSVTVTGQTTQDFVRHTQVAYAVTINGEDPHENEIEVNAGEQAHVVVTVKNFEGGASYKNVKVRLILDRDNQTLYDFDQTKGPYSVSQNGLKDFSFDYIPTSAGTYYFYIVVYGDYPSGYLVVDQHDWYKAFVPPPTGSLTVTVRNAEGKPMPSCGGTVEALLYDKYWTYLGRESKSYSGGESSVQIQFDDLAEDDYFIEVYQTPNTGLDLEEYWGGDSVTVTGQTTQDFVRHTQVAYAVTINGEDPHENEIEVNAGEQAHVVVTVKNFEGGASYKNVKVRLILDRDNQTLYDFDQTKGPYSVSQNGLKDFSFDYIPTSAGTYYFYIVVYGEYNSNYIVVDQHDWYKAIVVPTTPNYPPVLSEPNPAGANNGGTLNQLSGIPSTAFTFSVKYTDVDNDAPVRHWVKVKRTAPDVQLFVLEMAPSEPNPDYTAGVLFTNTTTLEPGTYEYWFDFKDFDHADVLLPPTYPNYQGPTVIISGPLISILAISASDTSPEPGETITLSVSTRNDGESGSADIGLMVVDPSGDECSLQWKESEYYTAGQPKTLTFSYTVPSENGGYTVISKSWIDCSGECGADQCCNLNTCTCSGIQDELLKPNAFSVNPPASELAQYWAPVWYQDTCRWRHDFIYIDSEQDYITNFEFDGNWIGTDNWENLINENVQLKAYIYYWIVETDTHWFIGYADFHPRDWEVVNSDLYSHENDMEGCLLAIKRDGSEYGQFLAMITVAHIDFYSYIDEDAAPSKELMGNHETIDGDIQFYDDHHPIVYVEAKGHGVYGDKDWQISGFPGGDGVVYYPTGTPEEPSDGNDRDVGYALKSIDELWSRRGNPETFSSYGTFKGDTYGVNKANAPWGWDDWNDVPGRGEIFTDPVKLFDCYFKESGGDPFPKDEIAAMGVPPVRAVIGDRHITAGFSEEGKLVTFFYPTVGAYDFVPYYTGKNAANYLYGAPLHLGGFLGIVDINTSPAQAQWLLTPSKIDHQNDMPAFSFDYSLYNLKVDYTVFAPINNNSTVYDVTITNEDDEAVSTGVAYYAFFDPANLNQNPNAHLVDPVKLGGWKIRGLPRIIYEDGKLIWWKENIPASYIGFSSDLNEVIYVDAKKAQARDPFSFDSLSPTLPPIPDIDGVFEGSYTIPESVPATKEFADQDPNCMNGILIWKLDLDAGESKSFRIVVTAGESEAEVSNTIDSLLNQNINAQMDGVANYWHTFLETARDNEHYTTLSSEEKELVDWWVMTMALNADNTTGAIIASPNLIPQYYGSWPRDGIYQSLAWIALGYRDIADKYFEYLFEIVDDESKWYQCHDSDEGEYVGFPTYYLFDLQIGDDNATELGIYNGLVLEEDQMSLVLLGLWYYNETFGKLPSTVSDNEVKELADYISSTIIPISNNDKKIDKDINRCFIVWVNEEGVLLPIWKCVEYHIVEQEGLIRPSSDSYEFPGLIVNHLLNVTILTNLEKYDAEMDGLIASRQSSYVNFAAASALKAAYDLTGDEDYRNAGLQLRDRSEEVFWNETNQKFWAAWSIFSHVQYDRLIDVSTTIGWPIQAYNLDPEVDERLHTHYQFVKNKIDTNKSDSDGDDMLFVGGVIGTELYANIADEEEKVNYLVDIMPILNNINKPFKDIKTDYIPEKVSTNFETRYLGAEPLGWPHATGIMVLLTKGKEGYRPPYMDWQVCDLQGDYPPCGEVTIEEVADFINLWSSGEAELGDVIDLINAWAGGAGGAGVESNLIAPPQGTSGTKINTSIEIEIAEGNAPTSIGVTQKLPEGWKILDSSVEGVLNPEGNESQWLLWSGGEPVEDKVINCSVQVPEDVIGDYTLKGEVDYGGAENQMFESTITIVQANNPPVINNPVIIPTIGNTSETFTWSANVTDPDGNALNINLSLRGLGDLNGNGYCDFADTSEIFSIWATGSYESLTPFEKRIVDIDCDYDCDVDDVNLLAEMREHDGWLIRPMVKSGAIYSHSRDLFDINGDEITPDYTWKITATDGINPEVSTGVFDGPIVRLPSSVPEIELTPSSHNFGDVLIGQCSSTYSFTLKNVGGETATGSVSLTDGNADQFTITSGEGSFSLSAGQSKTIKVTFCPTSTGDKSANLFAEGLNCGDKSSSLSGEGVLNKKPTASFSYSPENSSVNQTITFNASSSYDSDGFIAKYEWYFGDGINGAGKIVTHSYSSTGSYEVTLTVEDDKGDTDSCTQVLEIAIFSDFDHDKDGIVRGDLDDLRSQYNACIGIIVGEESEYDHNGDGIVRGDVDDLRRQYNAYIGIIGLGGI